VGSRAIALRTSPSTEPRWRGHQLIRLELFAGAGGRAPHRRAGESRRPVRTRQSLCSAGQYTTAPGARHVQVVCPPRQMLQGWCPTSLAPGRKRWPCEQLCGGRVIHEPSVQRTRAPTAGMKSTSRLFGACLNCRIRPQKYKSRQPAETDAVLITKCETTSGGAPKQGGWHSFVKIHNSVDSRY